ncbi:hypothetical protein CMQ_2893 [Grosmannia clavigera kw1407]|uniref:Uncharacterized protein n=1 Tax=Grosmannia clavigera (strain kw1407 / UAMH 11150) TaxID=655863 RepID=F0XHW7_GROCL|nr:uncharacterized protein CMQ_2893 [Grosmannia clavigera kw1407]EFX02964.1 hypothetical protein CMQ_2893 [Grosmannia clavigera kw1407]
MPLRQRPYNLLRQLLRQQAASGLQSHGSAAIRPRAFVSASSLCKQQATGGDGGRPNEITSIFKDLFPDEARRDTGVRIEGAGEAGVRLNDNGDGDGDDALQWLRTMKDGGLLTIGTDGDPDVFLGTDSGTERSERSEPTVLVLSGATASLLPSDFFRIAPRAARRSDEHVDGWAAAGGGLYKIVQDRDPATLTPRGRYFLYFGAPAAALAYAQEVRDLHGLARRAVQAPRHRNMGRFREAAGSLGETPGGSSQGWGWGRGWVSGSAWGSDWDQRRERHASEGGGSGSFGLAEEAAAALRSFSLLPPMAKLDLAMHLPDRTAAVASDDDDEAEAAAADTQTRILLVLEDTSGGGSDHGSDGGVTSIGGLRALIEADGEARNLPWAVSDGLNGVVPTDQMDEHASFSRFVVTLPDAIEARRFVRSWHRRSVTVPTTTSTGSEATAIVKATVLW